MPGSPVADIRNSYGAAFVGLLVSTTLFGATIVQTWIYFWNYRNRDSKLLKTFVAFITAVDFLHTILCGYAIYWYLILNYGNLESLDYSMWAMSIQVAIGTFVGAPVQLYYARRVYKLSHSIIVPILIVTLVSVGSSCAFVFTAKEFALKQFHRFASLVWMATLGMGSAALADILVASSMCWFLYNKRTGFARTDSIILTLMAYSINSGLLTSLLAIGGVICFAVVPSSMIWVGFLWAMNKCHVNSLLAVLNSRDYVRDRSTTDNGDNAFNLSSIRIEPLNGSKSRQQGVSVTVHRSTASDYVRNKSDHDVEPTFDISKPDGSLIQGQTSESSA